VRAAGGVVTLEKVLGSIDVEADDVDLKRAGGRGVARVKADGGRATLRGSLRGPNSRCRERRSP